MRLRSTPGFGGKDSLTEVGMNINCYINAKVYFKLACVRVRVRVRVQVRVRVRAYPHFPTTHIN